MINFIKDVNRIMKEEGNEVLCIEFENKEEYYEIMNQVDQFLDTDIKAYGVYRDKPAVIFQLEPEMVAEHELGETTEEDVEETVEEDIE